MTPSGRSRDLPDFPALLGLMPLIWMHARDAGYPIGGSLAFAQAIEQRYRGSRRTRSAYGARVDKVLVEDGRAVGVRLADGIEHRATDVISAADGYATIFGLLEGRYASPCDSSSLSDPANLPATGTGLTGRGA